MSLPDDAPISALRNLGPKSAQWCREAGIATIGDLRALGPVAAYLRLKSRDPRVSLNMLWGLYAGLIDGHWTELPPELKDRLRAEVGARQPSQKKPLRRRG